MTQSGSEKNKTKNITSSTKSRSKKGGSILDKLRDFGIPTSRVNFSKEGELLANKHEYSTFRKSSNKEKTGKVNIMKAGDCSAIKNNSVLNTIAPELPGKYDEEIQINGKWVFKSNKNLINENNNMKKDPEYFNKFNIESNVIRIICDNDIYKLQLWITCGSPKKDTIKFTNPHHAYHFETKKEAHAWASQRINQLKFIKNCLLYQQLFSKCKISN